MNRQPEDLSDDQLARLADALHQHETRLRGSLERGAEGAKPVDLDEPIGRLSRMDALAQQKMNEAGRRTQQAELAQVKLALEAIEAGEYGLCRSCDETIGFRRLQARPFATVCLRCQSERERR